MCYGLVGELHYVPASYYIPQRSYPVTQSL